jgi:transposase-like protein
MDSKKQRKHYNPQFKSKVVQEYLQGDKSLGELASEYEIHPNLILKWKSAAMNALPDALDERAQKTIKALKAQHEREKEELYAQIGRLTTQLNWLEKKARSVGIPIRADKVD